jgi:hypothetical protein
MLAGVFIATTIVQGKDKKTSYHSARRSDLGDLGLPKYGDPLFLKQSKP